MSTNPPAADSQPGETPPGKVLPSKRAWYAPTTAKYLLLIFLGQLFLYFSQQGQWFAFNREKGYVVLITFAATVLLLLLLIAFMLVGRLFKVKAQFSLAMLLLMVPVMAIPCAWLARDYQQAQLQKESINALSSNRCEITYDYEHFSSVLPLSVREAIASALGEDFFAT
jgi:hypothetical protein